MILLSLYYLPYIPYLHIFSILGNLMRAGDMNAFRMMAKMYTVENAVLKKEFDEKLKSVIN